MEENRNTSPDCASGAAATHWLSSHPETCKEKKDETQKVNPKKKINTSMYDRWLDYLNRKCGVRASPNYHKDLPSEKHYQNELREEQYEGLRECDFESTNPPHAFTRAYNNTNVVSEVCWSHKSKILDGVLQKEPKKYHLEGARAPQYFPRDNSPKVIFEFPKNRKSKNLAEART